MYFNVTYYVGNNIWSANIAHAKNRQSVADYYKAKADEVIISEAEEYDVVTAKRKGMPIVEI